MKFSMGGKECMLQGNRVMHHPMVIISSENMDKVLDKEGTDYYASMLWVTSGVP